MSLVADQDQGILSMNLWPEKVTSDGKVAGESENTLNVVNETLQ